MKGIKRKERIIIYSMFVILTFLHSLSLSLLFTHSLISFPNTHTHTHTHQIHIHTQLLIDRLDQYVEDASLTSSSPRVAQVPPPMTSVSCKPLFFDLALNHVEFPSLDDKTETKKQAAAGVSGGLTGLVKGLWGGWGSKN